MLSEGSQSSRTSVYARDTNRDDRDEDDDVHEAVVSGETCVESGKHERRSAVGVGVRGVQETVIGGADQEAYEGETENVEPREGVSSANAVICV